MFKLNHKNKKMEPAFETGFDDEAFARGEAADIVATAAKRRDKFTGKRKKAGHGAKLGKDDLNPSFLDERRTWNSYHAALMADKRLWQVIAVICLMIALISLAGIILQSMKSKYIPYIVEVDRLGQPIFVSVAEQARQPDQRIIQAQLASFIHDLRTVTIDTNLQTKAIWNVYAVLDSEDPATFKVNDWFNGSKESSPFKKAQLYTVNVDLSTIIPQSPATWQIDWLETRYDPQGLKLEESMMRALATIEIRPPGPNTSLEQIRRNPVGVYVKDISWSRLK